MVQLKCSCCSVDFDQHKAVNCSICGLVFGYSCVKLSQSEVRAINTNKNLTWTCAKCVPLGADIRALKEVILDLKREIAELKAQNSDRGNRIGDNEFEEIVREVQEREKRKQNLIIYGINEERIENRGERSEGEQQKASDILSVLLPDLDIVKVTRLGAYDRTRRSPRPLRVILKDEEEVHRIIRKKGLLRNNNEYKNVMISYDRTQKQAALFKKVKSELEKRKSEGETNLRIKYRRGIPSIITSEN